MGSGTLMPSMRSKMKVWSSMARSCSASVPGRHAHGRRNTGITCSSTATSSPSAWSRVASSYEGSPPMQNPPM